MKIFKKILIVSLILQLIFQLVILNVEGIYVFELIVSFNNYLVMLLSFNLLILSVIYLIDYPKKSIVEKEKRGIKIGLIVGLVIINLTFNYFSWREYFIPLESEKGTKDVKIYWHNKYVTNDKYEELIAQIKKENPDVIGLSEVRSVDKEVLIPLIKELGFNNYVESNNNRVIGEVVIFSKYQFSDIEILEINGNAIRATININDKLLDIYAIHISAPLDSRFLKSRNTDYLSLTTYIKERGNNGNVLVMGDFNTNNNSKNLVDFKNDNALTDSSKGKGIFYTWNIGPLWTHIDHILITDSIYSKEFRVLERAGSDHKAIVADISI